ncbi:hypothetical protein AB1N83_005736 [Pleurotus pulmonarius]
MENHQTPDHVSPWALADLTPILRIAHLSGSTSLTLIPYRIGVAVRQDIQGLQYPSAASHLILDFDAYYMRGQGYKANGRES